MDQSAARPLRVGWKETVGLPAWGFGLRALMDPASPLSTLAVERVEPLGRVKDAEGRRRLVLRLAVPMARGKGRLRIVHAFHRRRTRLGEGLGRCHVVLARFAVGELLWEGELALVTAPRRQHFLHLGRSDLAGRFLLDPAAEYLYAQPKLAFEPEPSLPLPEVAPRS